MRLCVFLASQLTCRLAPTAHQRRSHGMPGEDLRPFIAILTALLLPVVTGQSVAQAQSPTSVEHIVAQKVQPMLPEDASSGVAVAVRIDGKTEFFNFGTADRAKTARSRPTPSSILAPSAKLSRRRCWHKPSNGANSGSTIQSRNISPSCSRAAI